MKLARALCLPVVLVTAAGSQVVGNNPDAPKTGANAPPLTFTNLLQAPTGTKVDWPSLHGKVVVLEFWATWCVPCVAEIPVLNSLVESLDPDKVQFIAVDDEEPAVVEAFLKKKPISGWVGLDTSGKLYERYGVNARPATMIIDPNGRIASTTLRPENLKRDQLLALADGKPVTLGGDADPKVEAEIQAAVAKGFREEIGGNDTAKSLFEISLTPSDANDDKQVRMISLGDGQRDIINAPPKTLLSMGTGIKGTRITVTGELPDHRFNLHVKAPNADDGQLNLAIEMAVASGAKLHIEHHTATGDAYVLTAKPDAKDHFTQTTGPGFAFYNTKTQRFQCVKATADQLAAGLEAILMMPVINESGLSGTVTGSWPVDPKSLASIKDVLEKELGFTLVAAKRPIETVVLSAAPAEKAEKKDSNETREPIVTQKTIVVRQSEASPK